VSLYPNAPPPPPVTASRRKGSRLLSGDPFSSKCLCLCSCLFLRTRRRIPIKPSPKRARFRQSFVGRAVYITTDDGIPSKTRSSIFRGQRRSSVCAWPDRFFAKSLCRLSSRSPLRSVSLGRLRPQFLGMGTPLTVGRIRTRFVVPIRRRHRLLNRQPSGRLP